jgi:hypothetical protein
MSTAELVNILTLANVTSTNVTLTNVTLTNETLVEERFGESNIPYSSHLIVGTCISLAALLGLLLNGMVIYAFPR